MIAFRRAAAAASTLVAVLLLGAGCQPSNKPEPETPAVMPSADKVAAEHGYSDISHTLEIFGTCKDCQTPS